MPFLSSTPDSANTRLMGLNATQADMERAATALNRKDYGLMATVAGSALGGVSDLVDTVASSVPGVSHLLGQERGEFNAGVLRALDMPGLNDFYQQNKGGIEIASAIGGVIGAELVTRKFTQPAGLLMKGLKTLPYARRLATLDMQYAASLRNVRRVDAALAGRGALGMESFVGRYVAPTEGLFAAKASGIGPAAMGLETTRKSAVRAARALGFAKGVRNAALTEATMAVTLNQNDFLYTDDMSHNLMWMGLGLGISGGFESVFASYSMRKAVNNDNIRRVMSDALDPGGEEGARLGWHGKSLDPQNIPQGLNLPAGQGHMMGGVTDDVTSILVNAKSLNSTETPLTQSGQGLFMNRDRLANQHLQLATEEIQKATTKGIEGNGFSRFTMDAPGYGNHVEQAMRTDPTAFHGVEELGGVPRESGALETHLARERRVQQIIDETQAQLDEFGANPPKSKEGIEEMRRAEARIKRYKWKQQFIPTPLIDGERATLADLQVLDGWVEPNILPGRKTDETTTLWETDAEHIGARVGVDSNLAIYLPNNGDINKADHYNMLRLYRTAQRMLGSVGEKEMVVNLPKNANWFQLDLAEQLAKKNPNAVINYPEGMTRESAFVESFAQKAEVLRSEAKKGQITKALKAKKGIDYSPEVEASKLRVRLNLPRMTAYERGLLGTSEHPVESLLRGAAEYGPDEIRKMGYNDLLKGVNDYKRIGDFAPTADNAIDDISGSSFRYMLDESGKPTQPVLMYSRPMNQVDWMPDTLAERMATRRLMTVANLSAVDDYSGQLVKALMADPNLAAASKTQGLIETQVQGSALGSNHLNAPGAFMKALKARDWIGRDNVTLLAASRLQETVTRLAGDFFQREARGLSDIASRLDSPRNAGSKLMLNQFIASRPGWDLAKAKGKVDVVQDVLPGGGNVTKFRLADTVENQKRWQAMFGSEMPKGAFMPGKNGTEVGLDDTAMSFMTEFNRMTESLRANKNRLLKSQGLREIDKRDFYIPPPNINGKYIGFTIDARGDVVPGMTVIAGTESEFAAQQAKILEQIETQGMNGYRFRTRDDIKQFADIWDRAQMDMIDPGTTAIQGGKRSRGLLQGADIDMKGVEGVLESVQNQYMNHSQDVLGLLMKDQLRSAESRANIASNMSRNNANPAADQKYRSIHEMYIENLTGASPLRSKGSAVGGLYNWVEGKADQILASQYPGFSRVWNATNSFLNRAKVWDNSEGAKKDFESLTRYLGDYMPFKSSAEYVERLGAGSMPPQLKDVMGGMNRFTAAVMLRIFEPAMAIMNLGGMVNAMPSVIRHMAQQPGETAAQHAARVGHVGNIFPNAAGDGVNVGVLDMAKVMMRGFKRAWSKESHADFDFMRRNGFLTQEVAEFQKQFGAIETKADWERFMFGSPGARNLQRGQDGAFFGEKGLVGWMSIMTDKSEDFSRSWGHMTGLEIADQLGIVGREARNAFAHDMANKMIANYNPANRPEVFQGALGAPLGLFQSFVMAYYQRMFRYVESKDMRALATQYAMQGSLFGVSTVPGWSEATKFFFNHSNGEKDPYVAIQEAYGQSTADVILGGAISNVPKLFGLEGVDLYSRGDTAVRLPGLQPPPAYAVGEKLFGGIAAGLRALVNERTNITSTQLAEIASNMMPNRPLAGIVEQLAAGGNDTNQNGEIVTDTKSMAEGIYRMLGVRSVRQSMDLDAFYRNKNQQALQASQQEYLRVMTRSAIRDGDWDSIPRIAERYLEQGGDPRTMKRWFKSQYEAATQTRTERQLDDMLKSPAKMGYAARLLDAGVSIQDDEATESYSESLAVDQSQMGGVNDDMTEYDSENVMTLDTMAG